jgi:isocitrate dehydrogenase
MSMIIYTRTDEAPALATYSFFPIVSFFLAKAHVAVESRDISLAARILANFPDYLDENQRIPDDLKELGELVKTPGANIIKLPNISASIPQLRAAIKELQEKGFALPDYPKKPSTAAEKEAKVRYDKIKGSAVNPVLREGNSDRRAPQAVKDFARKNPHRMGAWSPHSKSHVASMEYGDFYGSEKSVLISAPTTARIVFVDENGSEIVLRNNLELQTNEVVDSAVMSKSALVEFLQEQIQAAKDEGVLYSLHLKATMMKVSDPIVFGHAVRTYFHDVFSKHAEALEKLGVDPKNGLGNLFAGLKKLPPQKRSEIEADFARAIENGPDLAMVNSDEGISNLHAPNDVIVDASMPAMIRTSGQMWNKEGKQQDAKAIIPDRAYAGVYQAVIDDCKAHGAYDPVTMGSVSNVGLMAQKAEEYGSHDKTFEIRGRGTVKMLAGDGSVLMEQAVDDGDIFRASQTKDAPVKNWVKLAVNRARATGDPLVFWLDENRAHDARLIEKVKAYLAECNTTGLEIHIMNPVEATKFSVARLRKGLDTISATGNVLRDYLTDLFPILELGTSAKMFSIVPLMQGGGLFETGAGGSAPKHVQQFVKENHLRWDSLGEFLALSVSLEHLGTEFNNPKALVLAQALEKATSSYLLNNKSPGRKVGELDNRGSHYYLALYWAQHLAGQQEDAELNAAFSPIAQALSENEDQIVAELNAVQGVPVDIGGYYLINEQLATQAMRPSETLNNIIP